MESSNLFSHGTSFGTKTFWQTDFSFGVLVTCLTVFKWLSDSKPWVIRFLSFCNNRTFLQTSGSLNRTHNESLNEKIYLPFHLHAFTVSIVVLICCSRLLSLLFVQITKKRIIKNDNGYSNQLTEFKYHKNIFSNNELCLIVLPYSKQITKKRFEGSFSLNYKKKLLWKFFFFFW